MKILTATILASVALTLSAPVLAETYKLQVEESCTAVGAGLKFECKKEKDLIALIRINNGAVHGVNNGVTENKVYELKTHKHTNEIFVVDNPVDFDGTSTIYITPSDNSFYWTEGAYSTILGQREFTVRTGKVIPL